MRIVNDVQAKMMIHLDERIKIYQNWIIMIDAVRKITYCIDDINVTKDFQLSIIAYLHSRINIKMKVINSDTSGSLCVLQIRIGFRLNTSIVNVYVCTRNRRYQLILIPIKKTARIIPMGLKFQME